MKNFLSIILLFVSSIAFSQNSDSESAKNVLKQYNDALQKMDLSGTKKMFTSNSQIFESGGSEGSYEHYLEHHLSPEFKEFKSFTISDYKVDVVVEGNMAYAIETYNYVIVTLKDSKEIKRKCVSTSVLKKEGDAWKISVSHNSSRK